jgi:TatA/E family protein of Tat protein translocase
MFGLGIWEILAVGLVVLLVFGGAKKFPEIMRQLGSGVVAFKQGLTDKTDADNSAESPDSKSK